MSAQSISEPGADRRRVDLDWLRVLAILLIFLFHSSRPFDNYESWHVKNNQLTSALTLPVMVGALWMMPLFFILSGAACYFSLRGRTARSYVWARVLRLLVPLVTVGWFVLSPPQVYIERVTGTGYNTPPFSGSFAEFVPHYLEGVYGRGGNFALHGVHLWYLYWLFVFSIVALPLFIYLATGSGRRLLAALAGIVAKPGVIFLLALPLCLSEALITLGIGPDNEEGGWYLVTYLILMVYGYVFLADERFDRAIQRHAWVALTLAPLGLAVVLAIGLPSQSGRWGAAGPALDNALKAVNGWLWLVAILGLARRYLGFAHPFLRYAGEAVLPFYMLHQTAIVVIAYVIRTWDVSIPLKYLILSTSAFAVIMLLYELLIRRINALRFLFGMQLLPRGHPVAQPAALR